MSAQKKGLFRKLNLDSISAMNLKFLPLPTVSASPETGLKFGVFVDYFYRAKSSDSTEVRPSLSWVQVLYTTRGQFTAEGATSTFTNDEKFYINFQGGFVNEYERYWGTTEANSVPSEAYTEFTYKRTFAQGRIGKNLGNRLFAGAAGYFSKYSDVKFSSVKQNGPLPLTDGNSGIAGGGAYVSLDRRDNQFSPSKGLLAEGRVIANFNLGSGKYSYTTLQTDLRRYREKNRTVWAHQLIALLSTDEMPLLEKWRVGGQSMMRGIFQGRYRGNNLLAAQSEFRYQLSRYFKVALFGSASNVADVPGRLWQSRPQFAGGTGLRMLVNKDKKLYLRADVAIGSSRQIGYYIRLGDAF